MTSGAHRRAPRTYSYWARLLPGAGPGTQARFKEAKALFFEAVNIEAKQRDSCLVDYKIYAALYFERTGRTA